MANIIDVQDAAENPLRVRGDSGEVTAHDLNQLIDADKYLTAKENAASGVRSSIKIVRFQPSGTVF